MSKYTKGRISAILAIRGMVPMGKLTQLTDQIMQVVEDVEHEKFKAGMERAAEIIRITNIISSANFIQSGVITEQYIKAIRKEIDND